MGEREAGVEETRQRIIEAARAMIVESGFHRASLGDIAKRADVTRATIYNHFGSKFGVLEAVATDSLQRAGLDRIGPLLKNADAREAWEASTRESTRMWAAEHEIFRKVIGLASVDPEAQQIVEERDAGRRAAMAQLAGQLAEQDYLRPGITPERACTVLTLLSSFATFDSLYTINDLAPETIADLLIDLSRTVID